MPRVAYRDLMEDEKHLWTYVIFPAIDKNLKKCMVNIFLIIFSSFAKIMQQ